MSVVRFEPLRGVRIQLLELGLARRRRLAARFHHRLPVISRLAVGLLNGPHLGLSLQCFALILYLGPRQRFRLRLLLLLVGLRKVE